MIVHFLQHGMTPCMGTNTGLPKDWPADQKWSANWEHVTCESCLEGKELILTYMLSSDGKAITCKGCGRTSFNPNDVRSKYCGYCHVFHDDIWPPSRKWWIEQGKKP